MGRVKPLKQDGIPGGAVIIPIPEHLLARHGEAQQQGDAFYGACLLNEQPKHPILYSLQVEQPPPPRKRQQLLQPLLQRSGCPKWPIRPPLPRSAALTRRPAPSLHLPVAPGWYPKQKDFKVEQPNMEVYAQQPALQPAPAPRLGLPSFSAAMTPEGKPSSPSSAPSHRKKMLLRAPNAPQLAQHIRAYQIFL